MCAAAAGDSHAVVLIATSPNRYSSLTQSCAINPISAPTDAGSCASAQAAFASIAAAEAAVAMALQAGSRTLQLSEADLFYCSPASPDLQETCRTGFDGNARPFLQALVDRQQQLKVRQCMPYTAALPAEQAEAFCNMHTAAAAGTNTPSTNRSSSGELEDAPSGGVRCSKSSALLAQGGLSFRPITETWEAQEHIRAHGGVLTSLTVQPNSLKAFYADPANKHRPYSCSGSPTAAAAAAAGGQQLAEDGTLQSTSIFVVGYDNEQNFWLAKAAQGRRFGDSGFMRVAYGECGVMDASKTFGVSFKHTAASQRTAAAPAAAAGAAELPTASAAPGLLYRKALRPAPPGKPAHCRQYSAGSFDYASRVAHVLGVPVGALLADNADVIRDLDQPLIGKQLLVCARRGAQR
ncbi:hypothetical protein COO60DRAFT_647813 [Scenedesmus sp. NREL 46B-D3]|nr:hypothetical protein COO60DRAFT_647813 [Scenedesmus sp. NREL 46B-D3]